MKRARIINAAVWAAIAVATIAGVCVEWHNQGAEWQSLAVAVGMYALMCSGLCYAIDAIIQDSRH